MILAANHLQKSFGITEVLKDVTFHLEAREKVALVGANGAGKTTLFQVLRGFYAPDGGSLYVQKDLRIGYLPQHAELETTECVEDELLKVFEPLQRMEDKMRLLEQQMKGHDDAGLMAQYASLQNAYEMADGYAYRSRVRGVLKGLGFEENEYNMSITLLSGGQRSRVALS
ncbi:MAG: ABC-F family ATP-binding cassette domain-containing protein, partial [Firmicutes bacterium]|nr:ABC-F family ATP-binding cassette domain-containing protein [Bacillota bacterium]